MADHPSSKAHAPVRKRLTLLLIGFAFALALGECLTRLLVPDPGLGTEVEIGIFREDPFVGFRNKPNLRNYAYGFIRVETNSLGYRGPEVSIPKPPGTYRILALGDSVTWGAGVAESDTFLRVLEQDLQGRTGQETGLHFEAINTSVMGYSTYQELVTLERDGLRLCPDFVFVGFVTNDAYPTLDPFNNVYDFHQPARSAHVRGLPMHEVVYPSQLLTFLRGVIKRQWLAYRSRRPPPGTPRDGSWPANSFPRRSWPILQGHLINLQALAAEHGFHLLVLLFPTYPQVSGGRSADDYQNFVGPFLAAEKIPYIDLYDLLRSAGSTPQFRDWFHLNVAGHRTTAGAVQRYLQQSQWFDGVTAATVHKCAGPGKQGDLR